MAVLASACVSSATYQAAVKDAEEARTTLQQVSAQQRASLASLQSKLDDATAQNAKLREELERLGTNVDALLSEKGMLATALSESRARLEELRRAEAASEARAQLYRDLALRLRKMIDAGDLRIVLREGRMVLQLPNDVLFDTGRVDIKQRGKEALHQVADVLKTLEGRRFQITGHTDNVPISTPRFPSNWELSTTRGLEVVRYLIGQGVPADRLAAAGYGEFDPVASNDDADGRAKNRRIEIALQPNVDELVGVPEAQ